nr:reverse transcriptase domain-containing protein [Tanacetum cinerariifolium]
MLARSHYRNVSKQTTRRRNLKERLGPRYARTRSEIPEPRRGRSKSPREKDPKRRTMFKRLEKVVEGTQKAATKVLTPKKHKLLPRNIATKESIREKQKQCQKVKEVQEGTEVQNQRSKSRVLRMTYPNHGSEDPKDHLKIFQAAAKKERWAMPTWCHMFNSTLTENARVWFDDLPKESIDSYDDLRKAFLENYLQHKKCIKDPVEICNIKQRDRESMEEFMRRKAFLENYLQHKKCIKDPVEICNIKQRDGESMEEFMRRYKLECKDVKGAPECMKISRFMHGITNPELIKRLHDKIPKSMDEMMSVTTTFLRKERQIEEMLKAGKLSHLIKELKQNHGKDQAKTAKKGETLGKDKPLVILMVQPWQRIASQRITQTFSPESIISFPNLGEEDGTEGPMISEAEIGGHCVHRIYVDGGSSLEILYEHCFSKFCPEIKNQLIPANTPLVRFSGEIIWPLGQISLLVKIDDEEHSTSTWMNFMVVRSPSPYNGIIGRPGVRKI